MSNNRVCVIGSGAAAYFAVKHLIESIGLDKSLIDIITTGTIPESLDLYQAQSANCSTATKRMTGIIPDKLLFGSDRVYKRDSFLKIDTSKLSYNPKTTTYFGGLTHVWGANLSLLTDSDLKCSFDLAELAKYDEALYSEFKATGDSVNGRPSNHAFLMARRNCIDDVHVENYINNTKLISAQSRLKIGYSNLAINVADNENGCTYCGECLTGCRTRSIWSAAESFERLDKRYELNIIPNSRVTRISNDGHEVLVSFTSNGTEVSTRYRKVFLGAGVLDSLDILANSKMLPPKSRLNDSTKYYTIFFTKKKSDIDFEKNNISLSALTYQYETPYGAIHAQIYPSTKILSDILDKLSAPKFIKKFIQGHFKIGMVYLPEGLSECATLNLGMNRYTLEAGKLSTVNLFRRYYYLATHYTASLMKFARLRYIKLPFYYRVPVLNSQHFGNVRNLNNENINDFLPKNIKTIDTTALKYVTGIPTTLLVAANAQCIIDKEFTNE